MARSFSLWIYLRFARRASASALDGPVLDGSIAIPNAQDSVPPVTDATPRIWLHATRATPLRSLAHLARQMKQARPGLQFMVTGHASTPALSGFPPGTLSAPLPEDRLPDLQAFLDRFQPSMAVLTGLDLPPTLICAIADRAIPLVLADVHLTPKARKPWRWPRRMAFSLLDRFDLILARDLDSIRVMQTFFSTGLNIEMTGRLEETTEALPHSESERNALAKLLRTRPVWLAAACPATEEAAVVAAHSRAMRYAHRILLILAPSEPSRGGALCRDVAGRRSECRAPVAGPGTGGRRSGLYRRYGGRDGPVVSAGPRDLHGRHADRGRCGPKPDGTGGTWVGDRAWPPIPAPTPRPMPV